MFLFAEDLQLTDVVLFIAAAYVAIGTLYYLAIGAVAAWRYIDGALIRRRLKRLERQARQRLEA